MHIVKKLIIFIFVNIFFFVSQLSDVQALDDNFTTNPSVGSDWVVYKPDSVTFNNPGITLSSYNSNSYPYLLVNSDLSIYKYFSVDFQFLEASPWGTAIVFTDNAPIYGPIMYNISDYVFNTMFSVWGSTNVIQSTICPSQIQNCTSGRWSIYPNSTPLLENTSYGVTDLSRHKLSIEKIDYGINTYIYKLYYDSNLINVSAPTDRVIKKIWIGNPQILGSSSTWPKLKIFHIAALNENPDTKPVFPYFSQLDPKWANEEYDTAATWAGMEKFSIGRWGCALSSAAMVLQKSGVKALDGTEIDPSKLNNWLKTQPDGYVGKGYLNWLAITRYVAESNRLGYSPTKFEFSRTGSIVYPSILGLPGHFIVVHGEDGDNWLVNDPASKTTTKIPKSTAYKSINTFVPSMTDMSYLMFVTDPKVNVKVKKESDKTLLVDWKEEYIEDKTEGVAGPTTKTGMIAKPRSGEYELRIDNPSSEPLPFEIYAYDINGKPWIKKVTIPKLSKAKYEMKYNREKLSKIKLENEKRSIFDWYKKKKDD